MIRHAVPMLALAAVAIPASAAEVTIAANGPVVELSVSESVKAKPDVAEVSAGVTTDAQTAVEAMRLNAQQMDAVVKRIKSLGVSPEDIQTSGINLSPRYDYDRTNQKQVFVGYQVSNRVSVTLRKVEEVGRTLDSLVEAGVTDISGPNFSIDDETAAKAQARQAAMQRAQAQALEYARLAGHSGVRLLEVSEVIYSRGPQPMYKAAVAEDAVAAAPTPVEPGLVSAGVNITVKYEMTG